MSWHHFLDICADAMPSVVPRIITDPKCGTCPLIGGWQYMDSHGEVVALKARYEGPNGKTLRPFFIVPDGWKHTKPEGFQFTLYGLATLSRPGPVFVCEGEKATAALHRVGKPAVGVAGTSHADSVDLSPLAEREVILWPDNDEAGKHAMDTVARRLGKPCQRVVPQTLGLQAKGDAADVVADILGSIGIADSWDGSTDGLPENTRRVASALIDQKLEAAACLPETPCEFQWASLAEDWMTRLIPPRDFVFENFVPLGCITLLLAAGGFGKSSLLLALAASVATGRALIREFQPTEEGAVCIVSLEDDTPEIERRLQWIATAYTFTNENARKTAERLKILSMPRFELLESASGYAAGSDLERLRVDLQNIGPRLLILDPLAALLGGAIDENDNASAQAVVSTLRAALPENAGVIVAHHVSKAERNTSGSARGASAWMDAARMVLALRQSNEKGYKALSEEERRHLAILETIKSNYSALTAPICLRRETISGCGAVWRSAEIEAIHSAAIERKAKAVRNAIVQSVDTGTQSITRQQATAKCKDKEGQQRGQRFRDTCAARAGLESISCLEMQKHIDVLVGERKLFKVKEGRNEYLRTKNTLHTECSDHSPECSVQLEELNVKSECTE